MITEFIAGGDFKDSINAVDTANANAPVNIAALPGYEVWYYTNRNNPFKFIREVPAVGSDKLQLLRKTDFNYVAMLTGAQTLLFQKGRLYVEEFIALTDADMVDGNFESLGSIPLDLEIVHKPISNHV